MSALPIRKAYAASSRRTRRTSSARSSPNTWCWSASARISAARRSTASQPEPEPFAADWHGGFYCPCHGSLFDLAGRVYKNKPAPDNLTVPPYKFVSDTRIVIGEDTKGA